MNDLLPREFLLQTLEPAESKRLEREALSLPMAEVRTMAEAAEQSGSPSDLAKAEIYRRVIQQMKEKLSAKEDEADL